MRRTVRERLYAQLTPDPETGCLLWTGQLNRYGYGRMSVGSKKRQVHRLAWELEYGPIPDGLTIDHVKARGCLYHHCANVAHLEPVTCRENVMRGDTPAAINAAKTHCPRGHPYDEANTYRHPRGERACRACRREQGAAYRAKAGGLARLLVAAAAAAVLLVPATGHAQARRFGSGLMTTQNGNHLAVSIPGPLFAGEQTWFDIPGLGRNLYWDSAGTDSNGYPIGYVQTCGTCGPYYLQGNGGGNVPTLSASTSGVSGVVWVWVNGHLVNRAASGGDGHYGCALGSDNHNGDRARINDWGTGPCSGGSQGWYTAMNWG